MIFIIAFLSFVTTHLSAIEQPRRLSQQLCLVSQLRGAHVTVGTTGQDGVYYLPPEVPYTQEALRQVRLLGNGANFSLHGAVGANRHGPCFLPLIQSLLDHRVMQLGPVLPMHCVTVRSRGGVDLCRLDQFCILKRALFSADNLQCDQLAQCYALSSVPFDQRKNGTFETVGVMERFGPNSERVRLVPWARDVLQLYLFTGVPNSGRQEQVMGRLHYVLDDFTYRAEGTAVLQLRGNFPVA